MSRTEQDSSEIKLEISNLVRKEHQYRSQDQDGGYIQFESYMVSLPGDTSLSTLWDKIVGKVPNVNPIAR
jgi:hypothetical protein